MKHCKPRRRKCRDIYCGACIIHIHTQTHTLFILKNISCVSMCVCVRIFPTCHARPCVTCAEQCQLDHWAAGHNTACISTPSVGRQARHDEQVVAGTVTRHCQDVGVPPQQVDWAAGVYGNVLDNPGQTDVQPGPCVVCGVWPEEGDQLAFRRCKRCKSKDYCSGNVCVCVCTSTCACSAITSYTIALRHL